MDIHASNDEIQEQTNKLFSSILIEQKKFMGVREGDESKSHLIEKYLQEYTAHRGKGFFYNYLSSGRGHGPFSEQIDGSIKYDLIGGIGPYLLGHSHPLYIKANLESACSDVIMCGNLQPYPEALKLTKTIIKSVSKSNLKHFWFTGSGSFANDLALKLIWQKKAPQYRVIACTKAFAGRSVATQDITHNQSYREDMPESVAVDHVPHFDQGDPENSAKNTIAALKEVVRANPRQHCALMMEIIQGEGGFIHGPEEYYREVFSWAKEQGLYIWIDEVQTFARTKSLFAFQHFNLDEFVDIVTVGKSLQVCGVLYTEELNPKPGLIAGTFNGSLAALNAGEKVIRYLTEGNFYGENGRISEIESSFLTHLGHLSKTSCQGKINYLGGVGTMIAFEVGDASKEITINFIKKLYDNGIIVFMAGSNPSRVRMLLPVCLSDEHINEIFRIIEMTVQEVVK